MGTVRRLLFTATLSVALAGATLAAHVPLQPPGTIMVGLDLSAGTRHLAGRAPGVCTYSPAASIHQAPGQMWNIRQRDGGTEVNFTGWRLGKTDSFTLFVTIDGTRHRVNTLQVGPATDRAGSGTMRYTPKGRGGQMAIDAVTDTGLHITGTLTCSGFVPPEENGD